MSVKRLLFAWFGLILRWGYAKLNVHNNVLAYPITKPVQRADGYKTTTVNYFKFGKRRPYIKPPMQRGIIMQTLKHIMS